MHKNFKNSAVSVLLSLTLFITFFTAILNFTFFKEDSIRTFTTNEKLITISKEMLPKLVVKFNDKYEYFISDQVIDDVLKQYVKQIVPRVLYLTPINIDTSSYFDLIHEDLSNYINNTMYEVIDNYLIEFNLNKNTPKPEIEILNEYSVNLDAIIYANMSKLEQQLLLKGTLSLAKIDEITLKVISSCNSEVSEGITTSLNNVLTSINTNINTITDEYINKLNVNKYLDLYRSIQYYNLIILGIALVISIFSGIYLFKQKLFNSLIKAFISAALLLFIISFIPLVPITYLQVNKSVMIALIQEVLYFYLKPFIYTSLGLLIISVILKVISKNKLLNKTA